jgi:Amt family ammonium transporter
MFSCFLFQEFSNKVQVRRDYLAWTPAEKEQKQDGVVVVPQHGIQEHQDLANNRSAPATPPEADTKEKSASATTE